MRGEQSWVHLMLLLGRAASRIIRKLPEYLPRLPRRLFETPK